MSLREATADDLPALTAFLRQHEATSMFPLSNLAGAGLHGAGFYGMRFWISGDVSGAIGLTNGGMLQPQWPGAADWAAARAVLKGAEVAGVIGPAGQVRPLVDALGLGRAAIRLDAVEPGFVLDLKDLVVPQGPGVLAELDAADPAVLSAWRADYLIVVTGTLPDRAAQQAPGEIEYFRSAGRHRLLLEAGDPVAMSGFNAVLPDVVQVGGVYVPPALRGKGRARRVVALHLAEARAKGVRRARLFAVSDQAARAYRAIGFGPADPVGLVLFADPQRVPAWA
ncbi:MAG: GNAT family N-acetyltransferase [Rhodobacter sp.]|nr:GNAT family N-acetyltransferase [Rhodobacter sp.]